MLKEMLMRMNEFKTKEPKYRIEKVDLSDYSKIMKVWESSVKVTHDFLKLEDFEYYKQILPTKCLPMVNLHVLRIEKTIIGFIRTSDKHLEMLFVEANLIGKGYGKALLNYAIEDLEITTVDVNEQNKKALAFYEKAGFRIVGRSEKDGMGKDYPILHMGIKGDI